MNIFVAGYGAVCTAGNNIDEILKTFSEGDKTIPAKSKLLSTDIENPVFEIPSIPSKDNEKRTYTLLKLALNEALNSLNTDLNKLNEFKIGVCLGTSVACQLNDIEFMAEYMNSGQLDTDSICNYLHGNLSTSIKKKYGFDGPDLTVVNACTSGSDSIGTAALWIRNGFCDIAIAGGADEINKVPLSGFGSLSNMSEEPCKPFDKNRSGLNIGEGAGIVIIASEKAISKLNLECKIELAAYAGATDAYHLTAPSPDGAGLEKAITKALQFADINKDAISFINAHGTATKDNDLVEGKVFNKVFGSDIKFLSTKGYTGHTLGAAGGIEAVFTIAALKERWIPASAGFREYDEEVGLSPVKTVTEITGNFAMSTSLAFGGNNSVLIFKRNNS